jgi:hypothetical protein
MSLCGCGDGSPGGRNAVAAVVFRKRMCLREAGARSAVNAVTQGSLRTRCCEPCARDNAGDVADRPCLRARSRRRPGRSAPGQPRLAVWIGACGPWSDGQFVGWGKRSATPPYVEVSSRHARIRAEEKRDRSVVPIQQRMRPHGGVALRLPHPTQALTRLGAALVELAGRIDTGMIRRRASDFEDTPRCTRPDRPVGAVRFAVAFATDLSDATGFVRCIFSCNPMYVRQRAQSCSEAPGPSVDLTSRSDVCDQPNQ